MALALCQPQQTLNLPPVKPDHDLLINDRYGGGSHPELLEFLHSSRVFADVLVGERDAFMRKKLFLCLAARSSRLAVDDNVLCHQVLLSLLRVFSPK